VVEVAPLNPVKVGVAGSSPVVRARKRPAVQRECRNRFGGLFDGGYSTKLSRNSDCFLARHAPNDEFGDGASSNLEDDLLRRL
jgi:hypothetical protein